MHDDESLVFIRNNISNNKNDNSSDGPPNSKIDATTNKNNNINSIINSNNNNNTINNNTGTTNDEGEHKKIIQENQPQNIPDRDSAVPTATTTITTLLSTSEEEGATGEPTAITTTAAAASTTTTPPNTSPTHTDSTPRNAAAADLGDFSSTILSEKDRLNQHQEQQLQQMQSKTANEMNDVDQRLDNSSSSNTSTLAVAVLVGADESETNPIRSSSDDDDASKITTLAIDNNDDEDGDMEDEGVDGEDNNEEENKGDTQTAYLAKEEQQQEESGNNNSTTVTPMSAAAAASDGPSSITTMIDSSNRENHVNRNGSGVPPIDSVGGTSSRSISTEKKSTQPSSSLSAPPQSSSGGVMADAASCDEPGIPTQDTNHSNAVVDENSAASAADVATDSDPPPSTAPPSSSSSSTTKITESTKDGAKQITSTENGGSSRATAPAVEAATTNVGGSAAPPTDSSIPVAPPPPVMKGTLSIDLNSQRRHLIRGMWNYEHSTTLPAQRFELVRNLGPDENSNTLPVDGEFHGSFSLAYIHMTSKGKQKERSKVIPETGVQIRFTKKLDQDKDDRGEYQVDGTGTNQFGVFYIYGTATPSADPNDTTMNIVFRKRYEPGPVVVAAAALAQATPVVNESASLKTAKDFTDSVALSLAADPLLEPFESFATGVVSLRGNLYKEESSDLGSTELVHRINGMWASGLDFILADPQNVRGMCNRFEYEHKSSVPSTAQFPVSGKYSGWFDLSNEDGTRTRINERDVTLKFRMNSAGYHNVEGKGSNVFGKYTITGSLTKDNIITIFRHFQPRKLKKSARPTDATDASAPSSVYPSTTAAPALFSSSLSLLPTIPTSHNTSVDRQKSIVSAGPKLSIDDVVLPLLDAGQSLYEPMAPPATGTYSAVSRGVLRVNEDGSHSCQGKWAVTREHFTNSQTSSFAFRLEQHFAKEASESALKDHQSEIFPLDSAMYKGTFQLKKQGSRYQTIVDQQIVMKFRKNTQGAFNVHGTGCNAIGEFTLLGTLVTSGKTGGQVELYRMYPPEKLAAPQPIVPVAVSSTGPSPISQVPMPGIPSHPSGMSMQRRESSRMVKLPSRLEEDDPDAQLSRTMDKCAHILKVIKDKDVDLGGFFSEPVDPVTLGIPTYFHVVREPMDLRTIYQRTESGEIGTPEEFARVTRLVFENAMTFNIDPGHSVHQAARDLLVLFNQKFRDVERAIQTIRRTHRMDVDETGKPKTKEDKKRKRQEEPKSLKRIRLDEVHAMTVANTSSFAALTAMSASSHETSVSRGEFKALIQMVQQMQRQLVLTHTALADLSSDEPLDDVTEVHSGAQPTQQVLTTTKLPTVPIEKKKVLKRKSEADEFSTSVNVDDSTPLSLEEQELLTDTINDLPQEHLGGVIQIIREAAPVGADEDEIDLEIDQLDHRTQRKLLRHIQKVNIFH